MLFPIWAARFFEVILFWIRIVLISMDNSAVIVNLYMGVSLYFRHNRICGPELRRVKFFFTSVVLFTVYVKFSIKQRANFARCCHIFVQLFYLISNIHLIYSNICTIMCMKGGTRPDYSCIHNNKLIP